MVPIALENFNEDRRNREYRFTGFGLCGLNPSAPCRTTDGEEFSVEAYVSPLEAKGFASAEALHRQQTEERAPGFFCKCENLLKLLLAPLLV